MINYTPQSQLSLEMFETNFESVLDKENRWVKLASLIPWDELAGIYSQKLDHSSGRKSVDIRLVIGALIVKHKLKLDDRGTVAMIQENVFIQYFFGDNYFNITVTPCLKNMVRRASEEYAGNKYIRIEHYFHLWLRAFEIAAAISDLLRPAFAACFRALAIR